MDKEHMKVLRLIAITSAALFAFITADAARPHSAKAQESELSAATQAADIWGDQSSTGSIQGSDIESPDAKPPLLSITGNWQGSISDNLRGNGAISADFTQNKAKLTGTWNAFGDFGNVVGKVTSHSAKITFVFFPKRPFIHCRFTLTSTSASDTEIIGNYKFTACGPLTRKEHGTIDITPIL
jgi:hypothetical protein